MCFRHCSKFILYKTNLFLHSKVDIVNICSLEYVNLKDDLYNLPKTCLFLQGERKKHYYRSEIKLNLMTAEN